MKTPGIIATASAVLLLLSLGLCGFSIKYSANQSTGGLAWLALGGMVLGALGLFVAGIMAIARAARPPR